MILVTSLQGFIEELHKTPDCKDWKVVSDFHRLPPERGNQTTRV